MIISLEASGIFWKTVVFAEKSDLKYVAQKSLERVDLFFVVMIVEESRLENV